MRTRFALFLLLAAGLAALSLGGGMGCDETTGGGGSATSGGSPGGSGTSGETTAGGTAGTEGGTTGGGTTGDTGGGTTGDTTGGTTGGTAGAGALIQFTPVGDAVASDVIDLEFLPGQGGEAIVIGQGGAVHYMRDDFTFLTPTPTVTVENNGEQGLLNVAADPDYAANHFIYLFYTVSGGGSNRVQRFTVTVNVAGDTFSLTAGPTVAEAFKGDSPSPGGNHNGGGMDFDDDGNLYIGFGDGGGSASTLHGTAVISQNPSTFLGKVVRVDTDPTLGSPSVFALGLRNPFTITFGDGLGLFIGDVGENVYEEIDFAPTTAAGINFGWDDTEGPTSVSGFTTPLHGYTHSNTAFDNADPDATGSGSKSIMAGTYYTGFEYGGVLTNRFFYSEFFSGWVRSFVVVLSVDGNSVTDDGHMGHNPGMSSLQQGPDGFLYGVSLGFDRILRVDLQ